MISAWKIGVEIAMTSNAAQVLGVLGRDLAGMGERAKALTGELNAAKMAAYGALGVIGGGAILGGLTKLVEAGRELVHQQALFQVSLKDSGLTAQQVAAETATATAAAWRNAQNVLGTTAADNLKSIRELRMVFGDEREAIANLPSVSKAQVVLNSVRESGGSDQVFAMAKALEIKGTSMDPKHFEVLLNDMVAAAIASGGRVLGSDYLSAFKFGRTATQGWGDQFVATILPTLIQEMKSAGGFGGATGPGNALQSAFQAVVGGTMSNKAATEFLRLHMLDPNKVIYTATGNVKGIKPGGVKGSAEFETNPYAWAQDVLVPALKAAGITSPDAIREEVAHLFVNRTAQQIMTMFVTQQQRFEKDAKLITQAGGLNSYDELQKTDPTTQMNAFSAAWTNLVTALGAPLVEPAFHMLGSLTTVLNDMSRWAAANPETVKIIGEVAAAIGVGLVVGGTVTLVGAIAALAGPVGAAAAGIAGLVTLFTALDNLGTMRWLAKLVGAPVPLSPEERKQWDLSPAARNAAHPPAGFPVYPGSGALPPLSDGGTPPSPAPLNPWAPNYRSPLENWPTGGGGSRGTGAPVPVVVTNEGRVVDRFADYLTHKLYAPPAGPTSYDPRATPLYPGATPVGP